MVDRVKLLDHILPAAELTPAEQVAIHNNLTAAIGQALPCVSLEHAKALPNLGDLVIFIADMADAKTLDKLSAKWEPSRSKLEVSQKANLKHDLQDLLNDKRPRYRKIDISLVTAQSTEGKERVQLLHALQRLAPKADLAALIKLWDPHNPSRPSEYEKMAKHLEALVTGEVAPHPSSALPLAAVRGMDAGVRKSVLDMILARENVKGLTPRLKAWDPHFKPVPTQKELIVERLLNLADGLVPPVEPPPKRTKAVRR
jgi:hypothetical protein